MTQRGTTRRLRKRMFASLTGGDACHVIAESLVPESREIEAVTLHPGGEKLHQRYAFRKKKRPSFGFGQWPDHTDVNFNKRAGGIALLWAMPLVGGFACIFRQLNIAGSQALVWTVPSKRMIVLKGA